MEYYSAIKKNEMMPFAATWMDMDMLSEVSQRSTNIISLIHRILKSDTNELIYKKKYTHRHRKQTYCFQRREQGEGGIN